MADAITMQLEFADSTAVVPVTKVPDGSFMVDLEALPANIRVDIFNYGLKQKLADSLASLNTKDEETPDFAAVQAKGEATLNELMEKWKEGNWGSSRESSDPLTSCIKQVLRKQVSGFAKLKPEVQEQLIEALRNPEKPSQQVLRDEVDALLAARNAPKADATSLLG